MNKPEVVAPPPGEWLLRLRRDDLIYLVKEQRYAYVMFPWIPPRPGKYAGELVFRQVQFYAASCVLHPPEVWYVSGEGCGFDGRPLLAPCAGYLGDRTMTDQLTGQLVLLVDGYTQRTAACERAVSQHRDEIASLWGTIRELSRTLGALQELVTEMNSRSVPLPARERVIDLDV